VGVSAVIAKVTYNGDTDLNGYPDGNAYGNTGSDARDVRVSDLHSGRITGRLDRTCPNWRHDRHVHGNVRNVEWIGSRRSGMCGRH
jgi:hypothetical protein